MRVDTKLIERVVEEVLGQLSQVYGHENILILGSRNDGASIPSQPDGDLSR